MTFRTRQYGHSTSTGQLLHYNQPAIYVKLSAVHPLRDGLAGRAIARRGQVSIRSECPACGLVSGVGEIEGDLLAVTEPQNDRFGILDSLAVAYDSGLHHVGVVASVHQSL